MVLPMRFLTLAAPLALAVAVPTARSSAPPSVPLNSPESWRVAGTAKILCSAVFVSNRDSAEALAHVTSYFLGPMIDSISRFEIDRQRKLVRLTVGNRITRQA